MPKVIRPIYNGPVPACRAACRCMRSMKKIYIFQTLDIDWKEMLVIYKNNVYDITPKQDEISVTFFFSCSTHAAALCTTPTEKLDIISSDITSAPKCPTE